MTPTVTQTAGRRRASKTAKVTERKPEFFQGAPLNVGIIGCGYVGLPLALRFAEAGHSVLGFDTDPAKVKKLNQGQTYIEHIPGAKIQQFVRSEQFGATGDFQRLAELDAVLICVPTPLENGASQTSAMSSRPRGRSVRTCGAASWWWWNRPPTPALPKRWCYPSWSRAGCAAPSPTGMTPRTWPPISSWRFRPSAKTPATSSSAWRRFPRWWAG